MRSVFSILKADLAEKRGRSVSVWGLILISAITLDYLTGPQIRFPVLDVVVVAFCALYLPLVTAEMFAVIFGVSGFMMHFFWRDIPQTPILIINEGIDAVMLIGVAYLVYRVRKGQEEIRILRGFLPICAHCKQIRGSDDKWYQLEEYITKHSEAFFSHGICPKCYKIVKAELEQVTSDKTPLPPKSP